MIISPDVWLSDPDTPDKSPPPKGTWQPETMGMIPESGLGERMGLAYSSVTHKL